MNAQRDSRWMIVRAHQWNRHLRARRARWTFHAVMSLVTQNHSGGFNSLGRAYWPLHDRTRGWLMRARRSA